MKHLRRLIQISVLSGLCLHPLESGAATPPTAVTLAADNVTTNQATLHGIANPNKQGTWIHFQYRTAAASNYSQATPPQKVGNGGQPVAVSAILGGLSPDTEQVFRLVATNGLGTTLGNELSFRTPPLPPIASTLSAAGITDAGAVLAGTVNPNASVPAAVYFQWGATTNYGNTTPTQIIPGGNVSVAVAAAITGLSPETTYHYRLVATNSSGVTAGNDQVLRTAAPFLPVAIVTSTDEAQLRAALAASTNVIFACDGIIPLTSTLLITRDTTLDATGRSLALSGSTAVRLFQVSPGVKFTLSNLGVTGGFSSNGAAIYNQGTLTLLNVGFSNNVAKGGVWESNSFNRFYFDGLGGAVCNSGVMQIAECVFSNNVAVGKHGGSLNVNSTAGFGGAVFNGGSMSVSNSVFVNNSAIGGDGVLYLGPVLGRDGKGGAVCNAGDAILANCVVNGNTANGGRGGDGPSGLQGGPAAGARGGNGIGGGILNLGGLWLFNTTVAENQARGGLGGTGGAAAGGFTPSPGSAGGAGGFARAGALFNSGIAQVNACSFAGNRVFGGAGGAGAVGGVPVLGGATSGGSGGSGGDAEGGGLFADGESFSLTNCTIAANTLSGGKGSDGAASGSALNSNGGNGGAGGNAYGGAVGCSTNSSLVIVNSTLAGNALQAGNGGQGGLGGGSRGQKGLPGTAGVVGGNVIRSPASSGNLVRLWNAIVGGGLGTVSAVAVGGSLVDGGHNICSDDSAAFTASGSLNNTDPKLGPLADYGGPTMTMALLPGSPAIDAGIAVPGVSADQRGVARPFGSVPDIGAFEFGSVPPATGFHLAAPTQLNGTWQLQLSGPVGTLVRLQESTSLSTWTDIATNTISLEGSLMLPLPASSSAQRFYRTVSP